MTVSETAISNKTLSLEQFLEFIYGDSKGYAYSPTKNPVTGEWREKGNYFQWPEEKDKLIRHINTYSKTHEVYYSPALFSKTSCEKKYYKSSTVLWVEFDLDDEDIQLLEGVPQPSLKLQSSTKGHEHWYWKLNFTIPEEDVIEDLAKRLTYATNADNGGWACNKVLRPISTVHHESGNTVKLLDCIDTTYGPQHFIDLPPAPNDIQEFKLGRIPQLIDVMALYQWDRENLKFFKKAEQPQGSRSSALTRLGHICMEMGMSNEETFIVVQNADNRWGKFNDRSDQEYRLTNLVKHCRVKYLNKPRKERKEKERLKIYSYKEFKEVEENIDWIVPGYFFKHGVAIVGGPPDVGKTQFTLRTAMSMALGKKFIDWDVVKPVRSMFFSLEMPSSSLQYLTNIMDESLSLAEIKKLEDMFYVWPEGYGLRLDDPLDQELITDAVKEFKPEAIFFDSFGQAVGDDMNSPMVVNKVFKYVKKILAVQSDAFIMFVHHTRKAQQGNRKPKNLDDLFGSRYISANVDTGLCLWPSGEDIEVLRLKTRLTAKSRDTTFIRRTKQIDFILSRIRQNPVAKLTDEDEDFLSF